MEENLLTKIQKTANYLKKATNDFQPDLGIILGSGLGSLADDIDKKFVIPYQEIPYFPISTVEGHKSNLIFGYLGGRSVVAMQGRFHFYEGYSMKEVTFPVRVMKFLGIKALIVSNASGGVNPGFKVGDIMVIRDHINLFPEHPLRGKNYDELGPRFPEMGEAYSKKFRELIHQVAEELGLKLQEGVYVGMQGPTFETPAEYGMIRYLGGDAVGMSTVPEVIVARHMDIPVLALSVITDLGGPDIKYQVSHEEVLNAASKAEPIVRKLVKNFIEKVNL